MHLRRDIERGFEHWLDLVLRHRALVLLATLALIGSLATGLPSLRIETSFESYLPRSNPAQRLYQRFRERFGSGERVIVLLRPESLYDVGFLDDLRSLHEALESELPYVEEVTSLVDARYLIGTPDSLIAEGLLDEPPRTPADLERLRRRIRSNPLYRDVIVSADESATAIIVELDGALDDVPDPAELGDAFDEAPPDDLGRGRGAMLSTSQANELVRRLDGILERSAPRRSELYVAGAPLVAQRLGVALTRDIGFFLMVSIACSALLLFLLFRNGWATLLPLLVVGLAVVGTLGWMGLVGIPITAVTEVLPTLLIAAGVGDSVHVQAIFFRGRAAGQDPPEALRAALGHAGLAILLTSVTTAASMAAFQAADLQPVIDLGRAAPLGVALAFLLSVTLLPVLISLTGMGRRPRSRGVSIGSNRIDVILLRLARLGTGRPGLVLGVVGISSLAALYAASFLRFSQDDLRWLPEEDPLRIATETLDRTMGGAEPFELLVSVGADRDLLDPAILSALDEIEERGTQLRVGAVSVAQSLSLVDAIEETHRALGGDPDAPLVLPADRNVISQELLLFESAAPDDFEKLVESDYRTTRVAMTVPFVDAVDYSRFARALKATAEEVLSDRGLETSIEVAPTGLLMLAGETFELLFTSMARSYAIGFGVIGLLMLLLIGDVKIGLLSWLPNVVPILLVLGVMEVVGAPLDVSSMLVGGILIGVVVDDTIHFAHHFGRAREVHGCALRAIRETLMTTGRAMLVTSVTLSIGFFAFCGAYLSNVSAFGAFCGVGVILALLADVVMMPALIAVAAPCSPGCRCHGADVLADPVADSRWPGAEIERASGSGDAVGAG